MNFEKESLDNKEQLEKIKKTKNDKVTIIGTIVIVIVAIIGVFLIISSYIENRSFECINGYPDYKTGKCVPNVTNTFTNSCNTGYYYDTEENTCKKIEEELTEKEQLEKFLEGNKEYSSIYEGDYKVDEGLNVEINIKYSDDLEECYDNSVEVIEDLKKDYKSDIKINKLTFVCKSRTPNDIPQKTTGYIEVNSLNDLTISDYENSAIFYDENKNITTLSDFKAKKKKEFKSKCKTYNYKEIFRNSEKYKGQYAKFTGKVVQVIETYYGSYELRVNVTRSSYGTYYSDTMYIYISSDTADFRILEDDVITIYGILQGTKTYTSVLGSSITIPYMDGYYVDLVG